MKRQRAKRRPLYRYDVYRGRRRGQARLTAAAVCAVLGLVLVLVRSLGIRFSGFLLLGIAALLVLSWLLDRLGRRLRQMGREYHRPERMGEEDAP